MLSLLVFIISLGVMIYSIHLKLDELHKTLTQMQNDIQYLIARQDYPKKIPVDLHETITIKEIKK